MSQTLEEISSCIRNNVFGILVKRFEAYLKRSTINWDCSKLFKRETCMYMEWTLLLVNKHTQFALHIFTYRHCTSKMQRFSTLLTACLIAYIAYGQVVDPPPTIDEFNPAKYLGRWFQVCNKFTCTWTAIKWSTTSIIQTYLCDRYFTYAIFYRINRCVNKFWNTMKWNLTARPKLDLSIWARKVSITSVWAFWNINNQNCNLK